MNNILGSVAAQVTLLAIADAVIGRRALTSVVLEPGVLLQATFNILLLSAVAAIITVGDRPLLGAGVGTWGLLLTYFLFIWILRDGTPGPHGVLPARPARKPTSLMTKARTASYRGHA